MVLNQGKMTVVELQTFFRISLRFEPIAKAGGFFVDGIELRKLVHN